ncbi:MAG TPA: site-specific DNA-methyltransferase [Dehalococcoidia bacterium]|nr:site-specific DNA-methyltransferase [Dehalococcoidia bacterium]
MPTIATPPAEFVDVVPGNCLEVLPTLGAETVDLIVTSPPYNIGKEYEKRVRLEDYIEQQRQVIEECFRVLKPTGSMCWQVGNWVKGAEIVPLDVALFPVFHGLGMKCRNRIVWHFEHGLHCSKRLSGRHETILWFTKSGSYKFNVDPIRVPQKYPTKRHFKGPRIGQLSCNPLGKNPGDVWIFPNVKHNHIEKTEHPCQFPVELVERLVLSLTEPGDVVLDPFGGVGTAAVAAAMHGRSAVSIDVSKKYTRIALERLERLRSGTLRTRPMDRPVYAPNGAGSTRRRDRMVRLLEPRTEYSA